MDYGPDLKPTDKQRVKMEDGHDYVWWASLKQFLDAPDRDDPETPRLVCNTRNCPNDPPNRELDGLLRRDLSTDGLDRWSGARERWEAQA